MDVGFIGLGRMGRHMCRHLLAKGFPLTVHNRSRAADFLDAPISGGPTGAEAGTLTVMIGGEQSTFDRALPVFEAMGKNIRIVGGTGIGSTIKLANQLLVAINSAGVAEALVLGVK